MLHIMFSHNICIMNKVLLFYFKKKILNDKSYCVSSTNGADVICARVVDKGGETHQLVDGKDE